MFDQMIASMTGQRAKALDTIAPAKRRSAFDQDESKVIWSPPPTLDEHHTDWMRLDQIKDSYSANRFMENKFRPVIAMREDGFVRVYRTVMAVGKETGLTRKAVILHLQHNEEAIDGVRYAHYTQAGVFTNTGHSRSRTIRTPLLVYFPELGVEKIATSALSASTLSGGDLSMVKHMLASGGLMRVRDDLCGVRFATIGDVQKLEPAWYPRGAMKHVLREYCTYDDYINYREVDFFVYNSNQSPVTNVNRWRDALLKRKLNV